MSNIAHECAVAHETIQNVAAKKCSLWSHKLGDEGKIWDSASLERPSAGKQWKVFKFRGTGVKKKKKIIAIFKIVEELTSNYKSLQVYQHWRSKQLLLLGVLGVKEAGLRTRWSVWCTRIPEEGPGFLPLCFLLQSSWELPSLPWHAHPGNHFSKVALHCLIPSDQESHFQNTPRVADKGPSYHSWDVAEVR